jgi:hypothetical protein
MPGKTYTPTNESANNMARYDTMQSHDPPVTPLGQQLGVDDVIKMLQMQRLMLGMKPEPTNAPGVARAAQIPVEIPQSPPAYFQAPEPQGYGGPMPDISAMQFGPRTQYNMGVTLPTSIGDLNARGSYTTPEQWKAMLGLRREF